MAEDNIHAVALRMPEALYAEMRARAGRKGESVNALIVAACEAYLDGVRPASKPEPREFTDAEKKQAHVDALRAVCDRRDGEYVEVGAGVIRNSAHQVVHDAWRRPGYSAYLRELGVTP